MIFKPHDYQRYAIERVLEQEAIGLFLDLGLGKTVITLTAVVELMHDRFDVARTLVIAPLRVAQSTWSAEAAKWEHTRHLRVAKILGTAPQRRAALKQEADIWIINRENVPWLVREIGKDWPFDMVVIDELSSFKSPSAQRFRAIRKVRPMIERIVGLTGTPSPNGIPDLWAQIYLLDRGERLGATLGEFRRTYLEPAGYVHNAAGTRVVSNWAPRPGAEREIYRRLSDLVVGMRAEDWLHLPERVNRVVNVPLSDVARAQYRRLERDFILSLPDSEVVAGSAAVLSNKLLQMANGAVYDERGRAQHIHDAKLDALEDIVESAVGNPVLVFYAYKHDLSRLLDRFPQARALTGLDDIEAWNRREVPILLAHPASAGHGLNLQAGGNTIVWFGLTWSLELYQQANGRLHRQGQMERVIVHHLVAEGTVDEDVMQVLAAKEATQEALLSALKARVERIRGTGVAA